jgi:hypothetical protein
VSRLDEFDEDDSTNIVFQDIILPALIGFIYTVIPAPIPHQLLKTVIDLKRHNQKKMAFRIKIDGLTNLTKGSVSTLSWPFPTTPPHMSAGCKNLSHSLTNGTDVERELGNA